MAEFVGILIVLMLAMLFGGAVAVGLGYVLVGIGTIIIGFFKGIAQILK